MMTSSQYAVCAGVFGSVASVFGKLSGLQDTTTWVSFAFKVFLIFLMLGCNGYMMTLFAKALQFSLTAVTPTITSSATNFVCSGIFGFLVFHEEISVRWCIGILIIIRGLFVINKSESVTENKKL